MKKEIIELRKLMAEEGVDAYFVPSGDFHGSEYVNEYFRTRAFLSGFTGSAGELLVTADGAWLWTDGRYFLQAGMQLEGSGIELMKMAEPDVPTVTEFIISLASKHNEDHPEKSFVLGYDGRVVTAKFGKEVCAKLAEAGCRVDFVITEDLGGKVWKDRSAIIPGKIWELPLSSAGVSTADKLAAVRREMAEKGAGSLLLTDLMECAWLLNLRGSDVLYTPVFFAFILITADSASLYVMDGALDDEIRGKLEGFEVKDYSGIYDDVAALPEDGKVWLDPGTCNFALYNRVPEGAEKIEAHTPAAMMKIVKNDAEIEGMRRAHILDGIAVTKFIRWVKAEAGKEGLTEISAADRLEALRRENEECIDLSFTTIAGYGPDGAIIHYSATPESDTAVEAEGFLLVDSGGQYKGGTTDITRTIAVGPLTQEMIDGYTTVLKSHLIMSMFRLEPDMCSLDLDIAARAPMRAIGHDFNHGLSHGVGHVLGVHEGPNTVRNSNRVKEHKPDPDTEIKAGMIMSNEPGLYLEGKFGVRIENLVVFKEDGEGNIVNEPLTCVPYERKAINKALLTDEEISYVDDYHKWVRDTLTPLLDEETAAWLADETAPL